MKCGCSVCCDVRHHALFWFCDLREQYVTLNKEGDRDWFHVECNKTGTRWSGKCWYYYEQIRYEFELEFEIPVTYPTAAPELKLPELEGLTSKMYRGGKICQTIHFQPLWAKNVPRFGIAHSLALSVSGACNCLLGGLTTARFYLCPAPTPFKKDCSVLI